MGISHRAFVALATLLALLLWSAPAAAAISSGTEAQIISIARAHAAADAAVATAGGDDRVAVRAGLERTRAEKALAAAVIDGIAAQPREVRAIVSLAAREAPALAETVAYEASTAFPGFAPLINDAAARPDPPPPPPDLVPVETAADLLPRAPPAPLGDIDEPPAGAGAAGDAEFDDELDDEFGEDFEDDDLLALYDAPEAEVDDPLEDINRAIFWFNDQVLDQFLLRPLAWTYGYLMPDVAKQPIRDAFDNLGAPVVFANDLLQGEFTAAGETLGRFVINSTFGVAGLFDVAADWGIEPHSADFGQTLYVWGLDSGPYLVLPLFGPSNVRDTGGLIVDTFLDPKRYILDDTIGLLLTVSEGIVLREEALDPLDALRDSSVDFYAALRSAFIQNRAAQLERD
jgi:phospholipid-binding lipoprotein MlaA